MSEEITIRWADGSLLVDMNTFFPCSVENLKKLMEATDEDVGQEGPEVLRSRMAAHCYDRARELEQKLPELQQEDTRALIDIKAADKALRKTREQLLELQTGLSRRDPETRKKIRDKIAVVKQLRDAQHKALKDARAYAYQTGKARAMTASAAERLRKNREYILRWQKKREW